MRYKIFYLVLRAGSIYKEPFYLFLKLSKIKETKKA